MGPLGLGLLGVSALGDLFSSGDPYASAEQAAQQQYQMAQKNMQPFITAGQNELPTLNAATNALLNPAQLRQQFLNSYQESPEAKMEQAMATQQGLGAASSMGLMGSSPALQAIQSGTSNISLQDQQNYLNDLMNKYTMGVNNARSIYGTGANLTGWMGQAGLSENAANNMGNLAYGRTQAPLSMLNSLVGEGVGYEMGGMPGAMAAFGFNGPQIGAINQWNNSGSNNSPAGGGSMNDNSDFYNATRPY